MLFQIIKIIANNKRKSGSILQPSNKLNMSFLQLFNTIKYTVPAKNDALYIPYEENGGFCPWNLQGSCEGLTRTSKRVAKGATVKL